MGPHALTRPMPPLWWKVVRDAWCLEVMHRAFTNGLMRYGMFTASKKAA